MKLNEFLTALRKLRVDRSKGAPAPHKAILLLSIIESTALFADVSAAHAERFVIPILRTTSY